MTKANLTAFAAGFWGKPAFELAPHGKLCIFALPMNLGLCGACAGTISPGYLTNIRAAVAIRAANAAPDNP